MLLTVGLLAACHRDPGTSGSPPPTAQTSSTPSTSPPPPPTGTTTTVPAPQGLEDRAIYLVMPDRFADGDPDNDLLGDAGCFDPADPRRFHGGDLRGLTDHLDYLEELGVDAVWITPAAAQVGCGYHGYWADLVDPDDHAVEPKLGGEADLHALSDALHARGMALILDLVANHTGRGATLPDQHPDWFHDDADCAGSAQPDVDCSLSGLPDFDQDVPEASAYLTAQAADWVERYDVDAVRLDTAKHLPADWLGHTWVPALGDRPVVGEILDEGGYDLIEAYLDQGLPTAFDFRCGAPWWTPSPTAAPSISSPRGSTRRSTASASTARTSWSTCSTTTTCRGSRRSCRPARSTSRRRARRWRSPC
ncbi:MAG: alpha-amylase family glycosyl hydrolase [Myxococcota bacterium]